MIETLSYDVAIIGAGTAGVYAGYELLEKKPGLKILILETGKDIYSRACPIVTGQVKDCIGCKPCSIMSGFGGAGAFSDGKYNITNDFGGTLYEYIGKKQALDLMHYVDEINMRYGGEGCKLYTTAGTRFKTLCIQNDLHLLDASVRHLGTDINYIVLENIYAHLKDKVEFFFDTPVESVKIIAGGYAVKCMDTSYTCDKCIVSVGRSGSKWMEKVCRDLDIPTSSNRVDIGVRVELPASVFEHLTNELYEKLVEPNNIQPTFVTRLPAELAGVGIDGKEHLRPVTYTLSGAPKGIGLKGNVLKVAAECTLDKCELIAKDAEGHTATVTVNLIEHNQQGTAVKLHFLDTLGWNGVAASLWLRSDAGDASFGEYGWPGQTLQRDENGYYTMETTYYGVRGQSLGYLFHNNNGTQTQDILISEGALAGKTVELWIQPGEIGADGKYTYKVVDDPQKLPPGVVINGNQVTFHFYSSTANKVYVAGSFNGWSGVAMTKSGTTFTYTQIGYEAFVFFVHKDNPIDNPDDDC